MEKGGEPEGGGAELPLLPPRLFLFHDAMTARGYDLPGSCQANVSQSAGTPLPLSPPRLPPAPLVAGGLPRRPGFLGMGQFSCASRSMLKQVSSVNRAEHEACFLFPFSHCLLV